MLEAYATLGFIVAHTSGSAAYAGPGVTYREPGLLAKQSARSTCSPRPVGLASRRLERRGVGGLGFAFPPTAERFERLEEAIQICLQMWSDRTPVPGSITSSAAR